ncbi:hypothetical protein DPMN_119919 [Dreissena polymorpha]|uniref:Uncharacterized protein n=1 Tax=Dreissena polymorpha TaxID=45954 RepID=A0A9D4JN67_DREPO|nr:hypothetical protein DPMN_119919 [Dreissena polymorpha]
MREALSSCRQQGKQGLFDFRYSTRLDFRLAENFTVVQVVAYVRHGGDGGGVEGPSGICMRTASFFANGTAGCTTRFTATSLHCPDTGDVESGESCFINTVEQSGVPHASLHCWHSLGSLTTVQYLLCGDEAHLCPAVDDVHRTWSGTATD